MLTLSDTSSDASSSDRTNDQSSTDGSDLSGEPQGRRCCRVESEHARRRRERLELESARILSLREEIADLERKEGQVLARFEQLERWFAGRRGPVQQALDELIGLKEELLGEIADLDEERTHCAQSGPGWLALIDALHGSSAFEVAMSCVIALNAIEMSLELDFDWAGWVYVENVFLLVYLLELVVRLRHSGLHFWCDPANLIWNYLDSIIVGFGMVDLWFTPLAAWFQYAALGKETAHASGGAGSLSLLRLLRVFRLLRLVKLVRAVKPLYRQLLGISQSFASIRWVFVLTLLSLYMCAIMWTTLLGHHFINPVHAEAVESIQSEFGTMPRSLFTLFRLMNDDDKFLVGVFDSVAGQMLFVGFTVFANWIILAILTSAMSSNMISSSARILREEADALEALNLQLRERQLKALFGEIDTDDSGAISQDELQHLLKDPGLLNELCDAMGLDQDSVVELHDWIAEERKTVANLSGAQVGGDGVSTGRLRSAKGCLLRYGALIEHVKDYGQPFDRLGVLRMEKLCQHLESRCERRFDEIWTAIHLRASGTLLM